MMGFGRRLARAQREVRRDAPLSDDAMTRFARELAVTLRVDGRARFDLTGAESAYLSKLGGQSARLGQLGAAPTHAMEWVGDNIRTVESLARTLTGGDKLPAARGVPRVQWLMRELVAHGDAQVSLSRLQRAVSAFDEVQPLEMREIWCVPQALRIELCAVFAAVSRRALEAGRERVAAEQWVGAGADVRSLGAHVKSCTFCERALQLMHEQEMPDARRALEHRLEEVSTGAEGVIRLAHEQQALDRLWLTNIMNALRMLEAADWQECFDQLSRTHAALMQDPTGLYPRMDEASRELIRRQVAYIARRAGLNELTVAQCAVRAAKEDLAREDLADEGDNERPAAGAPFGPKGLSREAGICWYLYDDDGRRVLMALLGAGGASIRPLILDRGGATYLLSVMVVGLFAFLLIALAVKNALFAALSIPLSWTFGALIVNFACARIFGPYRLLRLATEEVGADMRTLVVVPALLASEEGVGAQLSKLEALGCLEDSEDIDYLLLGDFCDAKEAHLAQDERILQAARRRVSAMNESAGREKYHYLHRGRAYAPADDRYRGHERKRGALMALNALLVEGDESPFDQEGAAAQRLYERGYQYVLTLDSDSRMLPDAARRLIGAMAHPLNRPRVEDGVRKGYCLLAPRVESALSGQNAFSRLLFGAGGLDSYPTCVSNVTMDVCGQGVFGGKGIYAVKPFYEALAGKLPDNAILSHDLIEGILAGAGYASGEVVYDGCPTTLGGYLKRMERWTRGDWQLLPFMGRRFPLSPLDRYLMADNLHRSLSPLCALLLLIFSLWTANAAGFLTALFFVFAPALLSRWSGAGFLRALAAFVLLPAEAFTQAGAAVRALRRVYFTHKNLLDWVTADQADGRPAGREAAVYARAFSVLALPAVLYPGWVAPAIGVAALFLLADYWMRDLETSPEKPPLSEDDRAALTALARDTWHFFETQVELEGAGLPPDNLQLDPPVGAAQRTSPTNIGLYMVACLSARVLDLIDEDEMRSRLNRTVHTLEELPKWRGQLYNWYDIVTLKPLPPRYVSSVDGGNLAACLIACSSFLEGVDKGLSERTMRLAREMDFSALYDNRRHLFAIGMDVEQNRLSSSRYDLMASESRILSFTAIALNKAPVKHWRYLGRASARVGGGQALISWSGTMFEYLMSELFMRAPEGSLLSQTNQAVVAAQKQHRGAGVFGVSESGYNAFDLQMNYQYRAFGLPALSLRGDADAMVIAPYASMLALPVDQAAALDNLNRMKDLNWTSEYGLYEAVDFAPPRLPEGAKYRVVFSHMAHHQGMILGAVANALAGDFLVRAYMGKPCTRAVSLLLEERRQARPALKQRKGPQNQPQIKRPIGRTARAAKPDAALPDAHLLYGGGATCFLTAGGGGYLKCNGTLAARFTGLLRAENDGLFVHVYLPAKKRAFLASGQMEQPGWLSQRASFDAGSATWMSRTADLEARLTACVSPEDGALLQKVELTSHAQSAMTVELTGCFAVALCAQADLTAHPAFQNLFVESAPLGDDAILFRRRSRGGERHPLLISLVAGAGGERIQRETDLQRLTGREGALGRPGGLKSGFTERFGRTLNPCSALRVRLHLKAGERRSLSFVTGIAPSEEEALKLYKRHAASEAAGRALLLSGTQARAMLDFLGLDAAQHHMLQRASALLTYPRLSARSGGEAGGLSVSGLWALGVSGDLPIIAVFVSAKEQMELVRSALRMHEFYRTMGVWCDLLLINDYGNDYEQPVRDALRELIAASHLRDLTLEPGGVFPLEGATLTEAQRETIAAFASIALRGRSGGMEAQLQKQLSHAPLPEGGREALPSVRMRPDGYGLAPIERMNFNGWGGFLQDGAYAIDLLGGKPTPSAWCNLLSNERFGSLVSERGGGFTWANNSYSGRLTPFGNDPLREGAGERLYLYGEKSFASLLPDMDFLISPLRVVHRPGMSAFASGAGALSFQVTEFVDRDLPVKCLRVAVKNAGGQARDLRLRLEVDWLMGTYPADLRLMRHLPAPPGAPAPMALSRGAMEGVGFASAQTGRALPGGGLEVSFRLESGQTWQGDLLLGWGRTIEDCKNICVHWRDEDRLETALAAWADRLSRLEVLTPDPLINLMLTKWLPYQALSGRIWGRAGLYQPGGAYGFRDQLQDMLCMIPIEPGLVRAHLIECCRHQFESGDVQHWWHPNSAGVRTRISDDLLFLPYVAAQYVLETGDEGVLSEEAPYLRDVEIEDGREDYYGEAGLSDWTESLNDHCLRAIRRACRFGPHGLPLMGSGDWNDGMNRVGARGQGESVWLGEFLAATCECYAEICPGEAEKKELLGLRDQMKAAVEEHGWDGQWYRRAFYDDGSPLGSASGEGGCMIDAIAQSWAVMAGLNPARSRQAMDSVWKELVDPAHGIIKLLTPPFDENGRDPGYIRGYPPGVRENGGQYTHAACWVLMAYAQLGDAKRAWQALNMLMPYAHSASSEQAKIYRVEPYVLSGDVYGEPPHAGRGGWTWYTGAASWLCRAAIRYLLGYERRGGRARLNALLPDDWDETSLRVRVGQARYTLTARKGEARISLDGRAVEGEWIDLTDDGAEHQAVFPPRQA